MKFCGICWRNGRSLWEGACLCTNDVLTNSAFYEWMGDKLKPLPPKVEEPKPVFVPKRAVLKFGEKLPKR